MSFKPALKWFAYGARLAVMVVAMMLLEVPSGLPWWKMIAGGGCLGVASVIYSWCTK